MARCTLLATLLVATLMPSAAGAQAPNQSVRVVTATLTVETIHRSTRGLVCRSQDGIVHAITVDPKVTLYDELAEGDVVVIDYIDAAVVTLKPGAALTVIADTTSQAKAQVTDPMVKVEQQLSAIVTIDEIYLDARTVVYHGKDTRRVQRTVQDMNLLRGLRAGDVVEIVLTRERAISMRRPVP